MGLAVAGLNESSIKERVAKLASGDWSSFKPSERAGLFFARKLTKTPGSVGKKDIDTLIAHLGLERAIDTIYSVSGFNHMTRVADAYQLPLESENVFMFMKPKSEEEKKGK